MTKQRPLAKIIPFPGRGHARSLEMVMPVQEDVPVVHWPPLALDAHDYPTEEPVRWLEEALVAVKVREIAFLRALAQLPPTSLRPEMHSGPLAQIFEVGQRLTVALEMLKLGQIGPAEVRALLPNLRRAMSILRELRGTLLDDLEPPARGLVQSEEARSTAGPLDVERELIERSRRRTLGYDPFETRMAAPGGHVLDMPDRPEIELRNRRERRLSQDNRAVNVEMDLAGWLEELPKEWLEGVARGLGLPLIEDRWEQERAVRDRLMAKGAVAEVVSHLMPIERRILNDVLRKGGIARYDGLVLHYGGDDETAWHWAEEPPTTSLERVRRSGLVYVGQAQVGRRPHRVAVIPIELRDGLQKALESYQTR